MRRFPSRIGCASLFPFAALVLLSAACDKNKGSKGSTAAGAAGMVFIVAP